MPGPSCTVPLIGDVLHRSTRVRAEAIASGPRRQPLPPRCFDLNDGSMEPAHFCRRCDEHVDAIVPWPGWKYLWTAWKVGIVAIVVCFPILASDYCVMLPCTMLYLAAGGPLRTYVKQRPVCTRCSLELDPVPARTGNRATTEAG